MSTYAIERQQRDRARAARARKFVFHAAGWDVCHDHGSLPDPGQIVVLTQPHGTPKNGTLGQVFVADVRGEFIGMVDQRSLTPLRRAR